MTATAVYSILSPWQESRQALCVHHGKLHEKPVRYYYSHHPADEEAELSPSMSPSLSQLLNAEVGAETQVCRGPHPSSSHHSIFTFNPVLCHFNFRHFTEEPSSELTDANISTWGSVLSPLQWRLALHLALVLLCPSPAAGLAFPMLAGPPSCLLGSR